MIENLKIGKVVYWARTKAYMRRSSRDDAYWPEWHDHYWAEGRVVSFGDGIVVVCDAESIPQGRIVFLPEASVMESKKAALADCKVRNVAMFKHEAGPWRGGKAYYKDDMVQDPIQEL